MAASPMTRCATTGRTLALGGRGFGTGARFQARDHLGLETLLGVVLDVGNAATIAELGQGDGQTVTPGTAGAANSVGVVLGLHRQAKVEHVRDRGHVDAAGGDIGGDQDLHHAVAQGGQATVAQALAESAVKGHRRETCLLQFTGQGVAFDLGAGKHNGLLDRGVAQPMVQQRALVLGVVGPEQLLRDVDVALLRVVDLQAVHAAATVVHHAHGQLLDARGKGGREHHGLATRCRQLVDGGQVIGKAQIQHAVGFVNHQELHVFQAQLARTLQIQQAARGGHHQVGVLQAGDLHGIGHAADHVGNAHAFAMAHQFDGIVRDLLRQLTGGAENQRTRLGRTEVARQGRVDALGLFRRGFATGSGFGTGGLMGQALGLLLGLLLAQQGVDHRQQKGGGLAAARLAGDHQVVVTVVRLVVAWQGQRNGLQLDLGWLGIAQIGHGLDEFIGQTQGDKAIGHGRGVGHGRGRRRRLQKQIVHRVLERQRRRMAQPSGCVHFGVEGHQPSIVLTRGAPQARWHQGSGLFLQARG